MTEKEAIKILRNIQNAKKVEYEDAACAAAWFSIFKYVYPEPEDYVIEEAIKALEEIQQYREIGTIEELTIGKRYISLAKKHVTIGEMIDECVAYEEIGTVEEFREAKRFKEYFDELYGTGLEVANWHENGYTEPFDNFYDEAIDGSEEE